MKKTVLLIALLAAIATACKTKKEATATVPPAPLDCSTSVVTYEAVKSIIASKCNRCHNYGSTPGGYSLLNIDDVKRAATNGALLGTIKHNSGYFAMPAQASKLDQATINTIECWVKNGMKE